MPKVALRRQTIAAQRFVPRDPLLAMLTRADVAVVLGAWLLTRAACLAAMLTWPSPRSARSRLVHFDGTYYVDVARHGYPTSLPTHLGEPSTLAFFPGYPTAIRAVTVLGLGTPWAALLLTLLAGGLAAVGVALLGAWTANREVGRWAGVLWCAWPASWVLSSDYSEALFSVCVAAALLCLLAGRLLPAGLAASLAATVRPTGLVLAAILVLLALIHRTRRQVLAAVLSLALPAAFLIYLTAHTGTINAWGDSERIAWGAHEDGGLAAAMTAISSALHPLRHPWYDLVAVWIVLFLFLLWRAVRMRLPWPLTGQAAGILALALTSGAPTYSSFPRISFTALPLFVAAAGWVLTWPRALRHAAVGLSAVSAVALGVVIAVSEAITP